MTLRKTLHPVAVFVFGIYTYSLLILAPAPTAFTRQRPETRTTGRGDINSNLIDLT